MQKYDFSNFVDGIKDLDWGEMIQVCERRCYELERSSSRVPGAVERRKGGSTRLSEDIKGILFWLCCGKKPLGLSDSKFLKLRVLCENLVEKKQLKPAALEVFDVKKA